MRPSSLPLPQALDLALSENPTVKVAEMEVQRYDYVKRQTWGNLLPQISASGSYTRSIVKSEMRGGISFGADNTFAVQGDLSLPLFAPSVYRTLKMNDAQMATAVEAARASRIDLTAEVKKAFYNILLAEQSLAVLRESEATVQRTVDDTQVQYKHGLASEYDLLTALRSDVAAQGTRVQLAASLIAQLDTLCALAETAAQHNYCRPTVDESGVIQIHDGRHPVVEKMRGDAFFVPNDTHMGAKDDRVSIITGPNMAGKSTYMRQVALIVLMAQIGSFVPAQSAHIGVVDRIFTRIGASDDLSAGQSTFMVEMTEVSELLRCATKNSLLILDEIGRGTSTFDGMSIARAVLEYCAQRLKAKTLFATHYHELTALEQTLPTVRNYNSYGIEVAKLAGLPDSVLARAREILRELESESGRPAAPADPDEQVSLSDMAEADVAAVIRRTQVDALSPLEALNLLYELKSKLQ